MPVRQTPAARGAARGRAIAADLCREAESARLEHGLSYADVGRAMHLSDEQVARICRGQSPHVSVLRVAQLLAVVGRDLSARGYPGGVPVRDAAHLALQARFAALLAPSLRVRHEVAVVSAAGSVDGDVGGRRSDTGSGRETGSGRDTGGGWRDQRAWDLVVEGSDWRIGVEAETRLHDIQALLRRLHLKQRDGSIDALILLVNKTAHNRRVIDEAGEALRAAFPGSPRVALARLRNGMALGENVVLVL